VPATKELDGAAFEQANASYLRELYDTHAHG
jgi:hypothetical protein